MPSFVHCCDVCVSVHAYMHEHILVVCMFVSQGCIFSGSSSTLPFAEPFAYNFMINSVGSRVFTCILDRKETSFFVVPQYKKKI